MYFRCCAVCGGGDHIRLKIEGVIVGDLLPILKRSDTVDGYVDFFIAALHAISPVIRMLSVRELGYIGDPRAVEYLLEMLDDASEKVRIRTIWALIDLNTPLAVMAIIEAAHHPCRNTRHTAVDGLAVLLIMDESHSDPRIVHALRGAMDDKDREIRRSAYLALELFNIV